MDGRIDINDGLLSAMHYLLQQQPFPSSCCVALQRWTATLRRLRYAFSSVTYNHYSIYI